MWRPYLEVIAKHCPQALNILDRLHMVAKLNKALDEVHAGEARRMVREGYEPVLKNKRWCLLKRPENLTDKQRLSLRELLAYNLNSLYRFFASEKTMDQTTTAPAASRAPVFARIAAGSLWTLLAFTIAIAMLFGIEAKSINTSGGWGWLMAAAFIMALATLSCAICAAASAISLYRVEPHRNRSIVFLVVCSLVAWSGQGIAIHVVGGPS